MNKEGIKIDGIPIEDYNGFTSRTSYGIGINEVPVVKPGIYFDGVKITTAEEWDKTIEEFRKRANDFIPKQKIRDKIEELKEDRKNISEAIEYAKENKDKDFLKYNRETLYRVNGEISVLEELLEEEK